MKQKLVRRMARTAVFSMIVAAGSLRFRRVRSRAADTVLRVGHFPNITHAQGLIAHALSRQGKGWFEQRLGPGVNIAMVCL